jgi:uncharacterized protein YggE
MLLGLAVVSFADIATVTVQGDAELKVPADRANFEVSVVTGAATPEIALQENSARAEKVLSALQRGGLAEKEISSGQFVVNPQWSPRPRQAASDWKPEIVGYTVTNTLRVQTKKTDKVGSFIAAAVKAGGNEVNGLHFDLADPRQYRQEAIRIATKRANEDARVLAVAADTSLGRVVSLNLNNARSIPVRAMADSAFMAEAKMAPPIIPGEVTVRASVTAVYELKNERK